MYLTQGGAEKESAIKRKDKAFVWLCPFELFAVIAAVGS